MRRLIISLTMFFMLVLPTVDSAQTYEFNRYGPTTKQDHLWSIAHELKPSKWLTNQQVMIAIQQLNPEAFQGHNINALRKGFLLKIPTLRMVQQIDPVDAELRVAYQNEHWNPAAFAKKASLAKHPKVAKKPALTVHPKVIVSATDQYIHQKMPDALQQHVITTKESLVDPVTAKLEDQLNTIITTVLPHLDQLDSEITQIRNEVQKQIQQAKLRIDVLEDENVVLKKQVLVVSSALHGLSDKLSVEEKEFNNMLADLRAHQSDISALFTEYGGFMMVAAGLIVLLFLVYGLFYSRRRDMYQRRPHNRARSGRSFLDNRCLFSSDKPTDKKKSVVQVDEDEDEYDFLNSEEGIGAKLDLARAYIDMGDFETARQVLSEVRENGKADLRQQADQILKKMPEQTPEPA